MGTGWEAAIRPPFESVTVKWQKVSGSFSTRPLSLKETSFSRVALRSVGSADLQSASSSSSILFPFFELYLTLFVLMSSRSSFFLPSSKASLRRRSRIVSTSDAAFSVVPTNPGPIDCSMSFSPMKVTKTIPTIPGRIPTTSIRINIFL